MERGSRVRLFVSSGPEQETVPSVVGLTRDAAETRLTREGLDVRVERRESDEPEDEVIAQSPSAGHEGRQGRPRDDHRLRGQEAGRRAERGRAERGRRHAACCAAEKLGVSVRQRTTDNEEEDGQVLDQRPGAGVEVDEGRSIIVIVGRFEARRGARRNRGPRRKNRREGRRARRRALVRARRVAGVGRRGARRPGAGRPRARGRRDLPRRPLVLRRRAGGAGAGRRACSAATSAFPVLHGPYGEDGTVQGAARGARHPLRGRRGDGLGRVHGQGAVQGPDGGQPPAAGRLPRDARGRAPGQARRGSGCPSS